MPRHVLSRRLGERAVVAAVGTAFAAVALAGCGTASYRNELVVDFAVNATPAQQNAVRVACPGGPHVLLEPPARNSSLATNRAYPVRYDITHADVREKAAIYRCLNRLPGVRGVTETGDA